MNWLFEGKLNKLGRHANPDPRFVGILEKQLKTRVGHPMWWVQSWKWAVSATSIAALATSATGVYAYTSDSVLPDHPLYGIRTAIERVDESLATQSSAKTDVKIKNIKRRVHEIEVLMARTETGKDKTKKLIETTVEKANEQTLNLPEPEVSAAETDAAAEAPDSEVVVTPEEDVIDQVDRVIEEAHENKEELNKEKHSVEQADAEQEVSGEPAGD